MSENQGPYTSKLTDDKENAWSVLGPGLPEEGLELCRRNKAMCLHERHFNTAYHSRDAEITVMKEVIEDFVEQIESYGLQGVLSELIVRARKSIGEV